MKLFFSYVRKKAPTLCVFLLLLGLTGAVLYLYELPLAGFAYAAILCVFVGGLVYWLNRRKR